MSYFNIIIIILIINFISACEFYKDGYIIPQFCYQNSPKLTGNYENC